MHDSVFASNLEAEFVNGRPVEDYVTLVGEQKGLNLRLEEAAFDEDLNARRVNRRDLVHLYKNTLKVS